MFNIDSYCKKYLHKFKVNIDVQRVGRFIVTGAIVAAIDLILLYVFKDILLIWYLTSSILAFIIAFIISFGLQKLWTFQDYSLEHVHIQFTQYISISAINLMINTALVFMFVELFGIFYLVSQIISILIIAMGNYFLYLKIFRN